MENITIFDLQKFTQGDFVGKIDKNTKVEFVSNDSRSSGKNWVYLAIKGQRLDGHSFVEGAFENGAILSIVEKSNEEISKKIKELSDDYRQNFLLVDNSYIALKNIASEYKKQYDIPCVAVTGSSGKTTTKDMIYYALSSSKPTLRNIGNLNSEIGLPMTVLNLDKNFELAIFEMGMYDIGEIDYLAEIIKPNVAVITNVGTAHIVNLKTRDNILKAKLEVTNYMTQSDFLIVNGDNDLLSTISQSDFKPKIFTFGFGNKNDIHVLEHSTDGNKTVIKAKIIDEVLDFEIPMIGDHNILNALSALSVCKVMGLDLKKSAQGLLNYQASKFRMEKSEVGGKIIINDSYNANPDSMKATISTMSNILSSRKIAILADMLELGENSANYHREIGKIAKEYVDIIIAIGYEAKYIVEGAREAGMKEEQLYHYKNNSEAVENINFLLKENDVIIIKGSRGMKLEEVAEAIC